MIHMGGKAEKHRSEPQNRFNRFKQIQSPHTHAHAYIIYRTVGARLMRYLFPLAGYYSLLALESKSVVRSRYCFVFMAEAGL